MLAATWGMGSGGCRSRQGKRRPVERYICVRPYLIRMICPFIGRECSTLGRVNQTQSTAMHPTARQPKGQEASVGRSTSQRPLSPDKMESTGARGGGSYRLCKPCSASLQRLRTPACPAGPKGPNGPQGSSPPTLPCQWPAMRRPDPPHPAAYLACAVASRARQTTVPL